MPRNVTVVPRRFFSTILSGLSTTLILGFWVPDMHGQEPGYGTEPVPCPPGFPALYTDPVFGTFWDIPA
jgi:hypothetical protein